jgi:hypothetical protein
VGLLQAMYLLLENITPFKNSIGQIRMNLNNISTIFQHQIIELKIALFHTQFFFFGRSTHILNQVIADF